MIGVVRGNVGTGKDKPINPFAPPQENKVTALTHRRTDPHFGYTRIVNMNLRGVLFGDLVY